MKDKNLIKTMLEHPIATWFLIDVTACGIAKIIYAVKSKPASKEVVITTSQPDKTE